jgi:hypothetical protein
MFTKFYSILQSSGDDVHKVLYNSASSGDDVSYSETSSTFWALSVVYLQSKRFESPLCFLVQVLERNLAGGPLRTSYSVTGPVYIPWSPGVAKDEY